MKAKGGKKDPRLWPLSPPSMRAGQLLWRPRPARSAWLAVPSRLSVGLTRGRRKAGSLSAKTSGLWRSVFLPSWGPGSGHTAASVLAAGDNQAGDSETGQVIPRPRCCPGGEASCAQAGPPAPVPALPPQSCCGPLCMRGSHRAGVGGGSFPAGPAAGPGCHAEASDTAKWRRRLRAAGLPELTVLRLGNN